MKRAVIRSSIFNVLFYALTALACVLCLPTLALPRRYFMGVVKFFVHKVYFLERFIMGLDYEVRGGEHLPKSGSFIVAAKHQSAYETMKLHILFKDPAVILKKELLSIPLWGLYLKKSDPIAIDRSSPDTAIQSIQEGARRMKKLGRPIVIFPQGTRVHTDASAVDKPYKVGVARLQEATDLPIIPMALNAGIFWPRNSWLKSPGCVIFEFLKPVKPGLERGKLLAKLEKETEAAAQSLMNEAKEKAPDTKKSAGRTAGLSLAIVFALLFGLYSFVWFTAAAQIKKEYVLAIEDLVGVDKMILPPIVTGYPGKLHLHKAEEMIVTDEGSVKIHDLRARGWPLPFLPITVTSGPIEIQNFKWGNALHFDSLFAKLKYDRDILNVYESALVQGDFTCALTGTADLKQEPVPVLDMIIQFTNHQSLLQSLVASDIIETRMALFIGAGLSSLADESGLISLPLQQKGEMLYAGPLPIMTIRPENKSIRREAKPPTPSRGLSGPQEAPAPDLEQPSSPSR
ncbi:MAG: 1-acyl-sn-glycerol-3-phosphate acyltransferase [Rhodospirillales bacterium]|nr:1-acyl-sn-glycerol-3-phosphate acyltransferase [Alphaproteobacteria bacterium]MCB9981669.1 1-acyl-sn-glycerol-3-phosphate acyltransferase [Rhodospirillales bacterium]